MVKYHIKKQLLGGCISTEACDSKLSCSITACFDCHRDIEKIKNR